MKFAAWTLLPWEITGWPFPALVAILVVLGYRILWAPTRPMPMRAALAHARRF